MTRPKFYGMNMEKLSLEMEKLETRVEFLTAALRVTRRQRDELAKALDDLLFVTQEPHPTGREDWLVAVRRAQELHKAFRKSNRS